MKNNTDNTYVPFFPSKAMLSSNEAILLKNAIGHESASLVNLYPPGDIVLCQGEVISDEHVETILNAINDGEDVLGLVQLHPPYISVVKRPDYEIVIRDPQEITSREIKNYCDLFRETFYNPPYSQLAYEGEDWRNSLSASQVIYGRLPSKHDYVDIETIDNFELPQNFSIYMDRKETEKVLSNRFRDPGYMALLYETATGNLKGFSHARVATLRRVWETEEFKWPLILSGNKRITANEELFFSRMKSEFNLKPESKILSVSGQGIHPDVRGRDGWFGKLMAATVSQISIEHASLPGLTELSSHGASRVLNSSVSTKVCEGILENGNPLAYVPTASHSLWHYSDPSGSRLIKAIRNQILKDRSNV